MAKERFFKRLRNLLSEGVEEPSGEEVESMDTSIEDVELSELPQFSYTPSTSDAEPNVDSKYYQAGQLHDASGEVFEHQDVRYRQEHEPFRHEPTGDRRVCVTQAHLYEIHPAKAQAVKIHDLSPLIISVTDNCVVYSKFETDEQGQIIQQQGAGGNDIGTYTLGKEDGEDVPNSTHFELPSEDAAGTQGVYYIPLFWIKDGELWRDHWSDLEDDSREVQLFGGLRGHRGPFWWFCGYNKLNNIGGGRNVYKNYFGTPFDQKNLRTLNERAQSGLSSPFSNTAQIKVRYKDADLTDGDGADSPNGTPAERGAADEILVHGNAFNKYWKIGDKGVAIVEDGLVSCLSDLSCKDLTTRELSVASVLTSSGTISVAACPTSSNNQSGVWHGGATANLWSGGTSSAGGGLTAFKVQKCGSTSSTDCVWVLGIDASGDYSSSAPTFPSFITGASSVVGITGAAQTSVIKSLSCVNVLSASGGTVDVYQAHSSARKFLESPDSADATTKVVECPSSNLCP